MWLKHLGANMKSISLHYALKKYFLHCIMKTSPFPIRDFGPKLEATQEKTQNQRVKSTYPTKVAWDIIAIYGFQEEWCQTEEHCH